MKNTKHSNITPALFLGIDVGKTDLFCHVITDHDTSSSRFDNSEKGIASLLTWLQKLADPSVISACLEQTGHYGIDIAKALHKLQIHTLFLVNPRQIKAFGQQKLRRNKSDTADAKLIARFLQSEHSELRPWQPKPIENERITELSRYTEKHRRAVGVLDEARRERGRVEAPNQSIVQEVAKLKTKCEAAREPAVLRSLKRRIKAGEKEIADLRKLITKIIDAKTALQIDRALLSSIPGLGEISCQIMLAELPDLAHFKSARELAAWAGVTPCHHVSGTSGRSTTPITKIGSANLRRALFMPAMNARVFNPLLKTFGDRLKENGKKPKQIIVAIMRKLLHQIYGILKSREPYNPEKRGFQNPTKA